MRLLAAAFAIVLGCTNSHGEQGATLGVESELGGQAGQRTAPAQPAENGGRGPVKMDGESGSPMVAAGGAAGAPETGGVGEAGSPEGVQPSIPRPHPFDDGRTINVYFAGDSHTKLPGLRKCFDEWARSGALRFDLVGAFSNGDFEDNQHSAVSGVKVRSVRERAKLELGAGKLFPEVSLVLVLIGTNNINDVGVDIGATLREYGGMLDVVSDLATSTVPDARLFVTSIPPIAPGVQGDVQVDEFNAGLPDEWDRFDARHPGNPLVRWDLRRAVGDFEQSNFIDTGHMNPAGYAKACHGSGGLIPATEDFFSVN